MREVKKVAIIGGGLIGMSWASLFLARGLDVIVIDPRPHAKQELDQYVKTAWSTLKKTGVSILDDVKLAEFSTSIDDASGVDFVQENVPDRLFIKRELIAGLERVIDSDVVIASSTSSLKASDIQMEALHPERILVGHPMNPPHILPMVELVGGKLTSEATVAAATVFYEKMKRVVVRVKKEVTGHLANRLTSALYREAVYIAAEGIATVEDIDKAITYGPGMRWAFIGPHLVYHLGGGSGGYRHYLDHLGPTQERRWDELGRGTRLTEEVKALLISGLDQELASQNRETLVERRDSALVELLGLKDKYGL